MDDVRTDTADRAAAFYREPVELTTETLGALLPMCEQTDCLSIAGHSTLISQPQSQKRSASTAFGTCFARVRSSFPRLSTVPVFEAGAGRTTADIITE